MPRMPFPGLLTRRPAKGAAADFPFSATGSGKVPFPQMPPRCLGSPPPQGEGRAGATAPERGKDSAGPSVSRNSGPSPSLRDTSPRRGERQEKEPQLAPPRAVGRQSALPRMPFPGLLTRRPAKGAAADPVSPDASGDLCIIRLYDRLSRPIIKPSSDAAWMSPPIRCPRCRYSVAYTLPVQPG